MIKWCNKCGGLYISGNDGERSFTGTPCRCRYTTITVEIIPDTPETADPIPSYRAQLETARDLLSRCPGIRTDETREYWDEVQAFLGRGK